MTAATPSAEATSPRDGLLLKNGRCVRMTSRISSSVRTDSRNHPVRNVLLPGAQHEQEHAEGQIVKDRTHQAKGDHKAADEAMSQRRGRSTISRSTLSPAMAIAGKSVRKLVSRICMGSMGRKGKKSEAPAMLNMLPKLALVVMRTYLSVLAKVVRPSSMPLAQHAQVVLQQHKVGGLLGHVHRLSTEMPTSAAWRAGASLMPSPI